MFSQSKPYTICVRVCGTLLIVVLELYDTSVCKMYKPLNPTHFTSPWASPSPRPKGNLYQFGYFSQLTSVTDGQAERQTDASPLHTDGSVVFAG